MNRRNFIRTSSLSLFAMQLHDFKDQFDQEVDIKMPVLFVGHGNPMNAIEDNEFTKGWEDTGKLLPVPKAILCVSAHWLTRGTKVAAIADPPTIHEHDPKYDAPGAVLQVVPPRVLQFAFVHADRVQLPGLQIGEFLRGGRVLEGVLHGCQRVRRKGRMNQVMTMPPTMNMTVATKLGHCKLLRPMIA